MSAVSSVATGADSRAELQFPDKSLTRLGANSRLTIRGDQRTLDLDEGVMFLQVPKQMGGAKIRTGAVTAAVTGTTVVLERLPLKQGGLKLIVIEGVVELFRNDKPGEFRSINAGEMLMMDLSSSGIPATKEVDLKQMLKSGNKFFQGVEGTPNSAQVNNAVSHQQSQIASGVLKKLGLVIPGRGNVAAVANNSSQVAHNAILVHAINKNNNGNGKGGQNLVNLLGPGNSGFAGIPGFNGNANGKGKGKAKGQGNGNGNGGGNGGGNGNGNAGGNGNGGEGNGNGNGGGVPGGGKPPKKK